MHRSNPIRPTTRAWTLSLVLGLTFSLRSFGATTSTPEAFPLPPLVLQGREATAHTQGLEKVGTDLYITARREDISPKRAFLFRTRVQAPSWEAWDISPIEPDGTVSKMDHPGGFQSDGTHLWIPLAESRRNGNSVIRAFALKDLTSGTPPRPVVEFKVADHIGAIAVCPSQDRVIGASWDTEKVYIWDLKGSLIRTLDDAQLRPLGLGSSPAPSNRSGIAVQDWKFDGQTLIASGLRKDPTSGTTASLSHMLVVEGFLRTQPRSRVVRLPTMERLELAHEAMAIDATHILFIPEDLGRTNRLFRLPKSGWITSTPNP